MPWCLEPLQGAQTAEAANALFELSRIVCRSLRPKPGSLVEWDFEQGGSNPGKHIKKYVEEKRERFLNCAYESGDLKGKKITIARQLVEQRRRRRVSDMIRALGADTPLPLSAVIIKGHERLHSQLWGISAPAAPIYLIRDRSGACRHAVARRLAGMGIHDQPTASRSPWQNGHAERLICSIGRECLDYIVVFGEAHLGWILAGYVGYFNPASEHPSVYVVEEKRFF